jgi:hypothetical protein
MFYYFFDNPDGPEGYVVSKTEQFFYLPSDEPFLETLYPNNGTVEWPVGTEPKMVIPNREPAMIYAMGALVFIILLSFGFLIYSSMKCYQTV